jgi:hypothetical protein
MAKSGTQANASEVDAIDQGHGAVGIEHAGSWWYAGGVGQIFGDTQV